MRYTTASTDSTLLGQICERKGVNLGEFDSSILLSVDHVYGHDRNTFKIVRELEGEYCTPLEKAAALPQLRLFMDHYAPPPTLETAQLHIQQRQIARTHGVFLGEVGFGIGHQIAVEQLINGGDVAIGVDSHTCTIGALGALGLRQPPPAVAQALSTGRMRFDVPNVVRVELHERLSSSCCAKDIALELGRRGTDFIEDCVLEFGGSGLRNLSMAERFVLSNIAVDLGARSAVTETDDMTYGYLRSYGRESGFVRLTAPLSAYAHVVEIDLREIVPMVAFPPGLHTARPVSDLKRAQHIDIVALGTCTNGRYEDIIDFLDILSGGPVAAGTRLIVTPASRRILLQLQEEGRLQELLNAGALVNPPGCGPCMGLHQGVLADGEVCLITGSRNQTGRMGAAESQVFISGAKVAAATARSGYIAAP